MRGSKTRGTTLRPGALPVAALAIVVGLTGCRRQAGPAETIDLVELFPLARTEVATREIDFADPASRLRLGSGWSWQERGTGEGEVFVWGVGERSTVEFEVIDPRDLELTFRCRGIRRSGLPPQELMIDVNGVEIETFELPPRIDEYRATLPATALRRGANVLGLGYRFHRAVGERSRRPLAVAWYELRFGDAVASGAPRVDERQGKLYVPMDSEVHFPVLAAADAELEIDAWSRRGEGEGELELRIEVDGAEPLMLDTLDGASRRGASWRLEVDGPARLSIAARETGGTRLGGAFALEGVRVSRPVAPDPDVPAAAAPPASESPPNIVIYLVDTLRPDRLGVYGHPASLTPRLDLFAEDAVVFERAVAQSSWTRSAVASLLTGLWPGRHGTTTKGDRLPAEALTLPELLAERGYETAAVLSNPNVSGHFGFRQGFERYFHLAKQADSVLVHETAEAWLDTRDRSRTFFLYVHTADPHTPYLPPEPYHSRHAAGAEPVRRLIEAEKRRQRWDPEPETIRQLNALYDAEIAFNDDSFGRLLDALRERRLYEDAVIVFVSDHGEEFYEHGAWTHGNNLHREALDVPLVVKFPGVEGGLRVSRRVQQADLVPTLLELAGATVPPGLDGQSVLPLLDEPQASGLGDWGERPVFAHLDLYGRLYLAVEEADFKLVQRFVGAGEVETQLFDVARDPAERTDLAAELPITTEYLVARLKAKTREGSSLVAEEALVDEELARELRALGYVP